MPVSRFNKCRFKGRSSVLVAFLVCLISLSFSAAHTARAQKTTRAKLRPGNENPSYPEQAQAKMIVGDVVFRANLSEEGSVESVHILQVPEKDVGFEDSVKETVQNWKFEPAKADGRPVPSVYAGKVGFSLRSDDEKAIRDLAKRSVADWNKGDAGKIASRFDKKEGRVHGTMNLAKTSQNVEKWIKGQLSGICKGTDVKLTIKQIQFFPAPDLARVTSRFALSGVSGETQPVTGWVSVLLLKDNRRWAAFSGQLVSRTGSNPLQAPKKIKDVPPLYPAEAQKDRAQGTVVLEGTVDTQGNVTEVEVIRSVPSLDQAAIDAVKQWEYEPASVAGQPTPMLTTMTVNFMLE